MERPGTRGHPKGRITGYSLIERGKGMTDKQIKSVLETVYGVFESANECDSNGEAANVVDGLFAIARAIERLATVLRG